MEIITVTDENSQEALEGAHAAISEAHQSALAYQTTVTHLQEQIQRMQDRVHSGKLLVHQATEEARIIERLPHVAEHDVVWLTLTGALGGKWPRNGDGNRALLNKDMQGWVRSMGNPLECRLWGINDKELRWHKPVVRIYANSEATITQFELTFAEEIR